MTLEIIESEPLSKIILSINRTIGREVVVLGDYGCPFVEMKGIIRGVDFIESRRKIEYYVEFPDGSRGYFEYRRDNIKLV